MNDKRIKEVCKRKGVKFIELSKKLGLAQYQSLTSRMKNPTFKSLSEIAQILDCEIAELLPVGPDYAHFYDENGIWQGIRRK